jgi:ketosteroid isomerase-like protein
MALLGMHQHVRQHRVEIRPTNRDVVLRENGEVVFEIVAGFFRRTGEHLSKHRHRITTVGDRQIPCLMRLPGECDA